MQIWTEQNCHATPGSPTIAFRARYAASAIRGVINLWLEQGEERDQHAFGRWSQDIALYLLFDLDKAE